MSEESANLDLVELVRQYVEAANRRDFAAIEALYAPDAVLRGAQIGTFEGRAAARGLLEDVIAPYEDFCGETEEVLDLGFGVAFAVVVARGRVGGGSAEVLFRWASVTIWREGLIARQTNYTDVAEARGAAERLAEERGWTISQSNVEIVRQMWQAFADGGLAASTEFWDDGINWRAIEGAPDDVGEIQGVEAMRRYLQDWIDTFEDIISVPTELLDAGDDRVIAVLHVTGRARLSGVTTELGYAIVYTLGDGKIVRGREYANRQQALEAVGLE